MTGPPTAALFVRPEWYERANCAGVGPARFYVERGAPVDRALAVCAGCVVRFDCLRQAMDHHEIFGVWGGYTQHELRVLRRRRVAS